MKNFYSSMTFNRKVLSLIGSFMIHFVIGTVYTTGNFSVYLASYLRVQGSSVTLGDLNGLFPIQIVSVACIYIIGTNLTLRYNPWM